MKYLEALLIFFLIGGLIIYSCYGLGIWPNGRLDIEKGTWWPDLGVGVCRIRVWYMCDIVYSDKFDWKPETYDSLLSVHLKMAQNFKP